MLKQLEKLRVIADPIGDTLRRTDPLRAALQQSGLGSTVSTILAQDADRRSLLTAVSQIDQIMKTVGINDLHLKLFDDEFETAKNFGSKLNGSHSAAMSLHEANKPIFRLPGIIEISGLARNALGSPGLAGSLLHSQGALEAAMRALRAPWLDVHEASTSARAFADIVAMGRGISEHLPFDTNFAEAIRSSLGDWRDVVKFQIEPLIKPEIRSGLYREQGFDPALVQFSDAAFDQSLQVAGLRYARPDDEFNRSAAERARHAFDQLRSFEIALRRFIERAMQTAFGDDWARRQLPVDMHERWRDKREVALKSRRNRTCTYRLCRFF